MTHVEKIVKGFPRVLDENGALYYGGSQKWYGTFWAKEAGCGAVSGSALSAFYGIGIEKKGVYSKKEYIDLMNRMYKVMTPGINGYPDPYRYRDDFIHFAEHYGRKMKGAVCARWSSLETPLNFIKSSINDNIPLAILVLEHQWQAFDENTWHWMNLIGIDEEEQQVILANYGNKECWDWNRLLEPLDGNNVFLVQMREGEKEHVIEKTVL